MDPREAISNLTTMLNRFEQTISDREAVIDSQSLSEACQKFRLAVQNLDASNAKREESVDQRQDGQTTNLKRAELKTLQELLARVIAATEDERETILQELQAIGRGSTALRGYSSLRPHTSSQYVSLSR